MNILHTSDWHLGRTLHGRKRYEEFEAFLDWLAETIEAEAIDVLLVAGDVFDSGTPSNRAQALYYRFLRRTAASCCRHVVIIAGNHDSPSFLDASRELLQALDVHVVGGASSSSEEDVLVLRDEQDAPEVIVCAVPYLRDRDIRTAEAGESVEDKERKLAEGIRDHYAAAAGSALRKREELGGDIPIVGMGHLFTAGGRTGEGDGVRELYVGSLAHVAAGMFPDCFDYLALGHLHMPQTVSGSETMRYSGSPLPMGFGEANQQKSVCRVCFQGGASSVALIDVPVFQKLERVKGDWEAVSNRVREVSETESGEGPGIRLEVVYDGAEVIGDLRERLDALVAGSRTEILLIRNMRIMDRIPGRHHEEENLDELNVIEVFERCLDAHDVPDAQRPELLRAYREAVSSLDEDDADAEERGR